MENWTELLWPIISFLLVVIVFPLVREWVKKIRNDRLREIAEAGIAWAEQEAKNHAKGNSGPMPSDTKKQLAEAHIVRLAQEAGIKVDPAVASRVIEEALGRITLKNGR